MIEIVWGASPSFGRPAYEKGHIPGAVAWDFDSGIQDPARRDVLDKPGLEALLLRSGILPETTLVLYSGLNNMLATFAFWLLKYYGHQDVRLMDGDRQMWLDEKDSTSSEVPLFAATIYQAQNPAFT